MAVTLHPDAPLRRWLPKLAVTISLGAAVVVG